MSPPLMRNPISELQTREKELRLSIKKNVSYTGGPDLRWAFVEFYIHLPVLQFAS